MRMPIKAKNPSPPSKVTTYKPSPAGKVPRYEADEESRKVRVKIVAQNRCIFTYSTQSLVSVCYSVL